MSDERSGRGDAVPCELQYCHGLRLTHSSVPGQPIASATNRGALVQGEWYDAFPLRLRRRPIDALRRRAADASPVLSCESLVFGSAIEPRHAGGVRRAGDGAHARTVAFERENRSSQPLSRQETSNYRRYSAAPLPSSVACHSCGLRRARPLAPAPRRHRRILQQGPEGPRKAKSQRSQARNAAAPGHVYEEALREPDRKPIKTTAPWAAARRKEKTTRCRPSNWSPN